MKNKDINLILALSSIKKLAYKNVYLNALPLFLGVVSLFKLKVNRYIFILVLIFPVYGYFLVPPALNPLESLFRNTQLLLMLLFSSLIIKYMTYRMLEIVVKYILIISGIFFVIEFIFYYPNPFFYREFLGFPLYRFAGIVGEPNYSGFLFFILAIYSLYIKKYRYLAIIFLFIFLTGSRASLLSFLVLLFIIYFKLFKVSKYGVYFLLFFPLIIYFNKSILFENYELIQALNVASSYRMGVWWNYFALMWDNPFGYGAFQTQYFFGTDIEGSFFAKEKMQAHNLILQLIADYGVYAYIVFLSIFVFWKKHKIVFLYLFPFVVNLYFINPINELGLYLFLSFLLTVNKGYLNASFEKNSH